MEQQQIRIINLPRLSYTELKYNRDVVGRRYSNTPLLVFEQLNLLER